MKAFEYPKEPAGLDFEHSFWLADACRVALRQFPEPGERKSGTRVCDMARAQALLEEHNRATLEAVRHA